VTSFQHGWYRLCLLFGVDAQLLYALHATLKKEKFKREIYYGEVFRF
jgi:hypothetical protein